MVAARDGVLRAGAAFDAAVVFCPHPTDGTMLYVSRKHDPASLGGVPGGRREGEESFRACAVREFSEEVGFGLEQVSAEPIFCGVSAVSGAYVEWFFGTISEHDWVRCSVGRFEGPEGLFVQRASWVSMLDPEQCVFHELYRRFLQSRVTDIPRSAMLMNVSSQ